MTQIFLKILYALITIILLALLIYFLEWLFKSEFSINLHTSKSPNYKLIKLRELNRFSQKEAAAYLGVSTSGYFHYERGLKEPVPESWYYRLEARLTSI